MPSSGLRNNLESAYEYVRDKMGRTLDRQRDIYDRKVHGKPFEKGDLVWLHCPAVPRGRSKKLHRPWSGRCPNCRMKHIVSRTRQHLVVHFNRLKLYPPDTRFDKEVLAPTHSAPRPSDDGSPGTNTELVDLHDDMPATPPTPRYPSRTRRPPACLFGRLHFPLNTGRIVLP